MKGKIVLVFLALLFSVILEAQTLSDAIRLTDNEQYEVASEIYKALIAKEPNNAAYYAYLGDNYLLSDNPDSALIAYQHGQKTDANNPLVKIGLAKYKLDK